MAKLFFWANLPKGRMTKIRKENGRLSTVEDFFFGIGNSTSTISYEFQTSKLLGFVQVRRFGAPV